ncbi:hypothetical protein [Sporosarcina psychrophila]|uniref:Uncharacterized protein n=1 Tax=Sporosarcina psychrophila TaxID=1476 RepID=A0ABV2KFS3_SPOPS
MKVNVFLYHDGTESSKELIYTGNSNNVNDATITLEQLESNKPFLTESEKGIVEVRVHKITQPIYATVGNEPMKEYSLVPISLNKEDIKLGPNRA